MLQLTSLILTSDLGSYVGVLTSSCCSTIVKHSKYVGLFDYVHAINVVSRAKQHTFLYVMLL